MIDQFTSSISILSSKASELGLADVCERTFQDHVTDPKRLPQASRREHAVDRIVIVKW